MDNSDTGWREIVSGNPNQTKIFYNADTGAIVAANTETYSGAVGHAWMIDNATRERRPSVEVPYTGDPYSSKGQATKASKTPKAPKPAEPAPKPLKPVPAETPVQKEPWQMTANKVVGDPPVKRQARAGAVEIWEPGGIASSNGQARIKAFNKENLKGKPYKEYQVVS